EVRLETLNLTALYPNLKVKLAGNENLNGQLTPTLCKGLSDFHNDLLKAYCLIKYNSDNLKKLNSAEREALEIEFLVRSGCTEWTTDLKKILSLSKSIIEKATDGMSGNQKTALFLTVIFAVGGCYAYSEYADVQKAQIASTEQISLDKANKQQTERWIQAIESVSSQSTSSHDKIDKVKSQMNNAYNGIVKTGIASGATSITISGVDTATLNEQQANELVANTKAKLETAERTLALEVESIKRTSDGNLTVNVKQEGSSANFNLTVNTGFIEPEEINLLFDAFKNGESVIVSGTFKTRSNTIEKGLASSIKTPQVVDEASEI
ncbi:MAG: hypothetical protein ACRC0U_04715, partial [Vibrio sp.]